MTGRCQVCDRKFALKADGTIRVHGPRNRRCPGSLNDPAPMVVQAIVCAQGCCPGCQGCYGMSLGCHQSPCRCEKPCTCRWADEDDDPRWRAGCERHDASQDGRRLAEQEDVEAPDVEELGFGIDPCPECGSTGACGYDDEGRPLVHAIAVDS